MGDKLYTIAASVAALLDNPDNGGKIGSRDSQLLFGETFEAEKEDSEWIYGTSIVDGHKGHIRAAQLAPIKEQATHFISQRWTHFYQEPGFKTRPVLNLGLMSRLSIDESQTQDSFVSVPGYGWVYEGHIKPLSALTVETDFVETALGFLGAPYLYGGRSAQGLDCSALVQLSLLRSGVPCLRDSDQQIVLGKSVNPENLQRGDLVFFKGHVGIMVNERNILNATARSMDTRIEKLADIAGEYDGITQARRLPDYSPG